MLNTTPSALYYHERWAEMKQMEIVQVDSALPFYSAATGSMIFAMRLTSLAGKPPWFAVHNHFSVRGIANTRELRLPYSLKWELSVLIF